MSQTPNTAIAVIGIDIGKNSFHVVGHDARGAIVLRQKWSRGQVEARLANIPPCLIGMEACVGAHRPSRKLASFGHDARLMPAKYVRPYSTIRIAREFNTRRRSLTVPCRQSDFCRRAPTSPNADWEAAGLRKAAEAYTADFELSSRQVPRSLLTIQ